MDHLTGAIVGHLVGDYLLQNDYLAQGKKRDNIICACHCFIWAWCVLGFGQAPWTKESYYPGLYVWLILFVTHYIQDRGGLIQRWMIWNGQEKFMTGPCAPWSLIVVDNVWHIVTIYVIWKLFGI